METDEGRETCRRISHSELSYTMHVHVHACMHTCTTYTVLHVHVYDDRCTVHPVHILYNHKILYMHTYYSLSLSDVSDSETAVQTSAGTSSPLMMTERDSSTTASSSNNSSFTAEVNVISHKMADMKLPGSGSQPPLPSNEGESKDSQVSCVTEKEEGEKETFSPSHPVLQEAKKGQPSSPSSVTAAAGTQGCALIGNGSFAGNESAAMGHNVDEGLKESDIADSEQPINVENTFNGHQLLTPPSSNDTLSVFSPHTPSGSPSHLNSLSNALSSECSESPLSSRPLSPHTPNVQSPVPGGAQAGYAVGGGAAAPLRGGGDSINKVKGGLKFASLEPKSTTPAVVIVSHAASPNEFTVSGLSF